MGAKRPITLVVANHLWIEHILTECLRKSLARPSALLDRRSPPFPLLVALCEALGIVEPDFAEVLRRVHALRNQFVHKLAFEPKMKEVEALQRALSEMKTPFYASYVPPSEHEMMRCMASISGFLERRAKDIGVPGLGAA